MQIVDLTDKKQLNDFVGSEARSQFLQSWEWGEFQSQVAGKIIRLGVEDSNKLVAAATLIKKTLPMGKSYFYCPRGPITVKSQQPKVENILNFLFSEIKKSAEQENVIFLRFEPISIIHSSSVSRRSMIKQTIDVQPSKTSILDLTKSEDEILRKMRQKTRYNIKLAEKKGIKILESGAERFEEFWQLLVSTGNRDEFNLHGRGYYGEMLKLNKNFLKLFFAEYRGKLLAANLVAFFGDTATYVHGGSANESRQAMAPYALQWQTIKLAKRFGYKYYDFYGVDEIKWPGVTRFKNGFGGSLVNYPGTFDLAYDQGWYSIYKMVRKVRRTF